MKLLTAYFNVAIQEEVLEALRTAGVRHYTQWPRLIGVGAATGARFDNHVWPGANGALQAVVEEALANAALDALQALRDSPVGRQAGIYAFTSPVERALT